MLKFYRYFYYKSYVAFLKWWGSSDFPHQTAMFFVTSSVWVNIATVMLPIFSIITGINLSNTIWVSSPIIVFCAGLTIILNYIFFLKGNRYQKIIHEFKNETSVESKKGGFWVITYIVVSFILFFILSILARYTLNNGFTLIGYFKNFLVK